MWISRLKVQNFSSFTDSGWIELDPGFNLFIGQNNSGKSALLRSISHPLPNNPHKNAATFRGAGLPTPRVSLEVKIEVKEIFERFRQINKAPTFPCIDGQGNSTAYMASLLNQPTHRFTLEMERFPGSEAGSVGGASIADFRNPSQQVVMNFTLTENGYKAESRTSGPDNLSLLFAGSTTDTLFYFDAQRLNIGKSPLNSPERLSPNANNLPAVLAHLQGARRPVFDTIEQHVLEIFGGMERITVVPRGTEFEVLIWPDRTARFEELAFGLNDSGTGVGQLLAIITAVVTSEQSVIVIDEVNSFLHPTAVKKLLSLLRSEYSHHQYIISTHSADAIASAGAERLYIVTREGFESYIKPISLQDVEQAREVASSLGFSMMDVFGYDRMVWVEGPTEEVCFPFLARRHELLSDTSIGFASVADTSSFDAKRGASRSAAQIYEQAGKRLSPLLRGMAFALDRERLSDDEVAKLEKSHRKLRFLPRRCFECYLLVPEAIASVISELDETETLLQRVNQELMKGSEQVYGASGNWDGDLYNESWLKRVDGAKLLSHVFCSLTEQRVEYRKTRDGIALLRWISEHKPDHLSDLVGYLRKVLEIAMRDTPP